MTNPEAQTAIVKLTTPIKRGEQVIDQITLRKPKGGALRGLNIAEIFNGDYNALRVLVPRIAMPQVLEADIDEMEAEDILGIAGEVRGFFMSQEQQALIMAHVGIAPPEQLTG